MGLVEQFAQDGWAVHWSRVLPAPLADCIAAFDHVVIRTRGTANEHRFGDELVKVADPSELDSTVKQLVDNPVLAQRACDVMGWKSCYLFGDSLYYKAPGTSSRATVGFHQDLRYWPMLATAAQAVTVVMPLYDATRESGGLGFVSGSHHWGLLGGDAWAGEDNTGVHGHPTPPAGKSWDVTYPELQAGAFTLHHPLTFHGSQPNQTKQHRRSVTVHLTNEPSFGRRLLWEIP